MRCLPSSRGCPARSRSGPQPSGPKQGEAIVNAVAHRDYRQHAYIQVSVSPSKVEIVSPGTLFDGLTKDEMLAGKSKLRNPVLADVFHKMGMIEKWGTGLRRIFSRCERAGVEAPVVDVGGSTVTVAFYRVENENVLATQKTAQKTTQKTAQKTTQKNFSLSSAQRGILKFLRENPTASRRMISEAISGITADGIKYNLARLQEIGCLRRVGPDKGGHWEVVT